MKSILIVTLDTTLIDTLAAREAEGTFRLKHVISLQSAKEWLSMQHFHLIVIDGRYVIEEAVRTIQHGWKLNPFCSGMIFNPVASPQEGISAELAGVRILRSEEIAVELSRLIEKIPNVISTNLASEVLVVEDLDAPRDIISMYIESLGEYKVTPVEGGELALELLRSKHFDLVVTDINMPHFSGIQLLKAIRSHAELFLMPVIVLTAHSTTDNLIEAIQAGASGFLVKPPRKKDLRSELERAKRMIFTQSSPRLCASTDIHLLEAALNNTKKV
jgi:two-component system chemotaxis response regulator CheY